ncbi:MAG: GNAT family N-acetyltransferase [Actinomycetota bacterium]
MTWPRQQRRSGLQYLSTLTALLDRARLAHPNAGLFDAGELQWWWASQERPTDDLDQIFWFDDAGQPEAAVIITAWNASTGFDPIFMPNPAADWVHHVVRQGLDHARTAGFAAVDLEVDPNDEVLRAVLTQFGFEVEEPGLVESWLAADSRPVVSPLAPGYELADRESTADRPHHMIHARRGHTDPEPRLRQTSLYRADLDLVVHDRDGSTAAYGLFWYNPTTRVGVVEPMRTEDGHQQRGLARHILTSGIDRLALAGARRIKICFDPHNEGAKHLYLSSGFEPQRTNDLFVGPTGT